MCVLLADFDRGGQSQQRPRDIIMHKCVCCTGALSVPPSRRGRDQAQDRWLYILPKVRAKTLTSKLRAAIKPFYNPKNSLTLFGPTRDFSSSERRNNLETNAH